VIVRNRSLLTGKVNEMEINATPEQIAEWQNGGLVQDVMPHLSPDEREFLISGVTKKEWDKMFDDDEDDLEEPYEPF